jgi:type II secretory pathway component PulM
MHDGEDDAPKGRRRRRSARPERTDTRFRDRSARLGGGRGALFFLVALLVVVIAYLVAATIDARRAARFAEPMAG